MIDKPIVLYTNHPINRDLCYSFALGSKSLMCHVDEFKDYSKSIATYGYLRGTGEAIKKSKLFFYMDHGYFNQSKRNFEKNKTKIIDLNGYFRVVFNDFWHNGSGNKTNERLKKLDINFKKINKNGQYIIVSEPTQDAKNYFNLHNWTELVVKQIKKFTDRKIVLHNRTEKISLNDLLKNAWAFVSDHSSAGFMAMQEGVPAYFTNKTLENISNIKDIEKHEINYSVFNNLAYEQWTINEIRNGECWDYLNNTIYEQKK